MDHTQVELLIVSAIVLGLFGAGVLYGNRVKTRWRREDLAREQAEAERARRRSASGAATILEVEPLASVSGKDGERDGVRFTLRLTFSGPDDGRAFKLTQYLHVLDIMRLKAGTVLPMRFAPDDRSNFEIDFQGAEGVWSTPPPP